LNLKHMAPRVGRLLRDFRFDRMDRVFPVDAGTEYPVVTLAAARTGVQ